VGPKRTTGGNLAARTQPLVAHSPSCFFGQSAQKKPNSHKQAFEYAGIQGEPSKYSAAHITLIPEVKTAERNEQKANADEAKVKLSKSARRAVPVTLPVLERVIRTEVGLCLTINSYHSSPRCQAELLFKLVLQ
jgi:hypothetical protein